MNADTYVVTCTLICCKSKCKSLRPRCNKNKMDYIYRDKIFQHYYFLAGIYCSLLQAQQIIFNFRPVLKNTFTYKISLYEAIPHSVIATTPVRGQYEMDWWAVCIPRASCLILGPHSSFNSAVKYKTVKLSDIWWEYMYVWLSHRTDTACTEPERQRTYNVSIEARSLNHFCSGKAISVTYSERVLVAFGIRNAMWMCHIVICGLSVSIVFSHVIT